VIRDLEPEDASSCDAIVAGLPEWFGNETGIRGCAEAVRSQPGLVAEDDGDVVGFCTYEPREPGSVEITWMAVRADRHRTGIGTAILDALVGRLAAQGVRRLLVKTLSERAGPYPPYDRTRRFYLAMGFERVAELDIWGPENPALLLAKPLDAAYQ
jgi:GNAT superfamily N-acetyltransferase